MTLEGFRFDEHEKCRKALTDSDALAGEFLETAEIGKWRGVSAKAFDARQPDTVSLPPIKFSIDPWPAPRSLAVAFANAFTANRYLLSRDVIHATVAPLQSTVQWGYFIEPDPPVSAAHGHTPASAFPELHQLTVMCPYHTLHFKKTMWDSTKRVFKSDAPHRKSNWHDCTINMDFAWPRWSTADIDWNTKLASDPVRSPAASLDFLSNILHSGSLGSLAHHPPRDVAQAQRLFCQ